MTKAAASMAIAGNGLGFRLLVALTALGCAAQVSPGSRDVRIAAGRTPEEAAGPSVTQIEMQQALQRFTGEFLDQLVDSCESLAKSESAAARREALRRELVYSSSILDITSGPFPEVNVLDMVVFIRLSRSALERYWMPEIFGDEARPLASAFVRSEDRAWRLAAKILTDTQRTELNRLIDVWQSTHPDQVRVEMVRFEEFSARGGRVTEALQRDADGLLGSVKGATQLADQGLLLAERGMFLGHRLPFLLRLQARVGAEQLLTDSLGRFEDVEALVASADGGRQILEDLAHLIGDSRAAATEARATLEALKPVISALPPEEDLRVLLASGNQLADKALALLGAAREIAPDDPKQLLSLLEARAEHMLRRLVFWLGLLSATLVVLFWGGYYTVRRLLR